LGLIWVIFIFEIVFRSILFVLSRNDFTVVP